MPNLYNIWIEYGQKKCLMEKGSTFSLCFACPLVAGESYIMYIFFNSSILYNFLTLLSCIANLWLIMLSSVPNYVFYTITHFINAYWFSLSYYWILPLIFLPKSPKIWSKKWFVVNCGTFECSSWCCCSMPPWRQTLCGWRIWWSYISEYCWIIWCSERWMERGIIVKNLHVILFQNLMSF